MTLHDTDFELTEKQTSPALNKMKIHWISDETPLLEYGLKWIKHKHTVRGTR